MSEDKKNKPMMDVEAWKQSRQYTPEMLDMAKKILYQVIDGADVLQTIRKNPVPVRGNVAKHALVTVYHEMVAKGEIQEDPLLLAKIRMKPMRTLSGVTTVTVLTKPFPCPGNCIFCPTDERMPKSYLPDEPGAARAFQNDFDPFDQVASRINAYEAVGHPVEKIELLILGGSWTNYPHDYQSWFIQRCLDAMNGCDSTNLEQAQSINEASAHRNVGMVIETRPDLIDADIIRNLRKLGVTKIQLGIQSLNDAILKANNRGHNVQDALKAVSLLRAAGFKIVLHWMPNLLNATPQTDRIDFSKLWEEKPIGYGFCPDELKIYPTQLIENTELFKAWKAGQYQPYDTETLTDLIVEIKPMIKPYCRINRIIRDIPAHHVVSGNTRSSLRMDVQKRLAERGQHCSCIRCREIKKQQVDPNTVELVDFQYHAAYAKEHFLQFVTPDDKLAGYLRLSLPDDTAPSTGIEELKHAALIREVHVYGQSLPIGAEQSGAAQHVGLGKKLIEYACIIAKEAGFEKLAVIAAIGTRHYYESRGFSRGEYYLFRNL